MAESRIKLTGWPTDATYVARMKARPDETCPIDHDLRRLRAEIESALRCWELLERLGVRFRFSLDQDGEGVRIEVCDSDGEFLRSVPPRQLLRLLEGGPSEVELWAMVIGAIEPVGADRG
jgi:hypothetical protein